MSAHLLEGMSIGYVRVDSAVYPLKFEKVSYSAATIASMKK